MTASHFNSRRGAARVGFLILLLAAGITGTLWLRGQDTDSPITISDGSLTVDAAVPWSAFRSLDAENKAHPDASRSVTQVAITLPGHNQTIPFSAQKCVVTIHYASTDFTVSTVNRGKGLQVSTNFGDFNGGNTTRLVHKNRNAKISHVTVTRDDETVFDSDASGGTKIVISYR